MWGVSLLRQLEKYQEQPALLDPHLEELVTPLMGCLQAMAIAAAPDQTTAAAFEPAHRAGFLLHILCGVRGYKSVVRFFPHEAADLERTLALLHEVRGTPSELQETQGIGPTCHLFAQALLAD